MNATNILEKHLELSEQAHKLLLEENSFLKEKQTVPESDFLERKKTLLDELADSLEAVKRMRKTQSNFSETEKEMIRSAQNRTMQGLYLDRENEQLLLKHSVVQTAPDTRRVVTEDRVRNAYGNTFGAQE